MYPFEENSVRNLAVEVPFNTYSVLQICAESRGGYYTV